MGMGDEIMASGRASALFAETGRPVAILDRHGKPRWSDVWRENAEICRPEDVTAQTPSITDGGWCRPYIDYDRSTPGRWVFRAGHRARPGRLVLDPVERSKGDSALRGGPFVLVEPNIKPKAPEGKRWAWRRWQALVSAAPDLRFVQCGPRGTRWLDGVDRIRTETFREACGVLAMARAAVLLEGGLHHAAAALGVRAVVIFGCFIAPAVTGYALHENLFNGTGLGCGNRRPSGCCKAAMAGISANTVAERLRCILVT